MIEIKLVFHPIKVTISWHSLLRWSHREVCSEINASIALKLQPPSSDYLETDGKLKDA